MAHMLQINSGSRVPLDIQGYMNCSQCIRQKPLGISPANWANISAGVTKSGQLQVWCIRHNMNIALVDLAAQNDIAPNVQIESFLKMPADQLGPIINGVSAIKNVLDFNEKDRFIITQLIIDDVPFKLAMERQR